MTASLPTDHQILEEIYKRYYDFYERHTAKDPSRQTKIFVPIDIQSIADALGTEPDIVFGRLYYHLEPKYGHKEENFKFFSQRVGHDMHCIHFPLLATALAAMREEKERLRWPNWIAAAALAVSIISLIVAAQT